MILDLLSPGIEADNSGCHRQGQKNSWSSRVMSSHLALVLGLDKPYAVF